MCLYVVGRGASEAGLRVISRKTVMQHVLPALGRGHILFRSPPYWQRVFLLASNGLWKGHLWPDTSLSCMAQAVLTGDLYMPSEGANQAHHTGKGGAK